MGLEIRGNRIAVQSSNNEYLNKSLDSFKTKSITSVNNSTDISNSLTSSISLLNFFDSFSVNMGPLFNLNIQNQSVLINEECVCKIFGEINFEYENSKQFAIYLSVNGNEISPPKIGTGYGVGKPGSIVSNSVIHLNKGDIVTLEAVSLDGDKTLNIKSASVTIESISIV